MDVHASTLHQVAADHKAKHARPHEDGKACANRLYAVSLISNSVTLERDTVGRHLPGAVEAIVAVHYHVLTAGHGVVKVLIQDGDKGGHVGQGGLQLLRNRISGQLGLSLLSVSFQSPFSLPSLVSDL